MRDVKIESSWFSSSMRVGKLIWQGKREISLLLNLLHFG